MKNIILKDLYEMCKILNERGELHLYKGYRQAACNTVGFRIYSETMWLKYRINDLKYLIGGIL